MGKALSAGLFLSAVDDCRSHSSAGHEYDDNPYHYIAAVSGLRAVAVWHIVRTAASQTVHLPSWKVWAVLAIASPASTTSPHILQTLSPVYPSAVQVASLAFTVSVSTCPGGRDVGDVLCRCITLACNFYRRCVGSYPCLGAGGGFFNF